MVSVAPKRPTDLVIAALSGSNPRAALLSGLPLLEQQPTPLLLALLARAALRLKKDDAFVRALDQAAHAAVDAGNLPVAVVAASYLRATGADAAMAYEAIARAFGRGSSRLKERRGVPPELPKSFDEVPPIAETRSDADLIADARRILAKAAVALEALGQPTFAPAPLFSSLEPEALRAFIEIFEVQLVAEGERVVTEGELGSEAFVVARGELDVEKRAADGIATLRLARVGSGALVGEMALLLRSPRAATVTAERASVLLRASKEALDRVAQKTPRVAREFAEHCRRRLIENLAKTCVLFRNVSSAERVALVERFAIKAFEPGERIVSQGKSSDGLYIVASGDAAVVRQDDRERTVVAHLGAGDILGEVALVFRRPTIADVVAHHPTITLFLPRERFLDLVRAHPKMFVDLYELAVRRDEETSSLDLMETIQTDDSVLV
jgi:cAMP-dependent protein kinase regulator